MNPIFLISHCNQLNIIHLFKKLKIFGAYSEPLRLRDNYK